MTPGILDPVIPTSLLPIARWFSHIWNFHCVQHPRITIYPLPLESLWGVYYTALTQATVKGTAHNYPLSSNTSPCIPLVKKPYCSCYNLLVYTDLSNSFPVPYYAYSEVQLPIQMSRFQNTVFKRLLVTIHFQTGSRISHSSCDVLLSPHLLSCFALGFLFLLLPFFARCTSLLVCYTLCSRHVGLFFTIPVKILLG